MVVLTVLALALQSGVWLGTDSVYSSAAVRRIVERASESNRRVPDSLASYQARVESELSFVAHKSDGSEATFSVEQTASVVRWDRSGDFEQRIIGYRTQSVGLTLSAVGLFQVPWTVPVLYGNRITLLFGQPDTTRRGGRRRRRQAASVAVHPFAEDREAVYRFSGGDTVVTLRPGGRDIPIVRVHVEPRAGGLTRSTMAFRGDVELDARRAQIVRMRGYFVTIGPKPSARSRLLASQLEAVAYIELENGEFDQQFWLPTYQRVEAQAGFTVLGEQRGVFRVLSRFRGMSINPARVLATSPASTADTLRGTVRRLTFAPSDSIDQFAAWSQDLGELSATAHADDFADVAPDTWRPTGPPVVRLRYESPSDLFRYNRIEGAYSGIGGEAKLRDAGPGIVARANVGWAWVEQTLRGRASIERQVGLLWPSIRAGRSLDITNDFREPFDSGSTLGALFSVDDYDYVDRRSVMAGLTFFPDRRRDVRLRIEGGIGSDRYVRARRTRGLVARGDSGFRFNRGVDEGAYRIGTAKLEIHPDVNAAFVRPGIGALIQAEVATGDLSWRRAELRLVARRMLWGIIYAARADIGAVTGDSIPPQQLFELGENQNLPGYGYKEFAGNQAAVIRGLAMYPLPVWRAPLRIGRWVLPGVAPLVSFGAQGGWASATTSAARASILRLGTTGDSVLARPSGGLVGRPVSRPTDGFKSSIDVRLRFFGGAVSAGVARATDHHDAWRFVLGLAQVL
jgi:hypothetical protein